MRLSDLVIARLSINGVTKGNRRPFYIRPKAHLTLRCYIISHLDGSTLQGLWFHPVLSSVGCSSWSSVDRQFGSSEPPSQPFSFGDHIVISILYHSTCL